ncbi:MAG TPA: hypothetical protein VLE46_13315 [Nitrospira sp.]|jgi:hypothetical protein|nr:hypothetical protein [Nitrospira sp.]
MKKDLWLYVIALMIGALTWGTISTISSRREAWDSSLYFSVGMPVICAMSAILGFIEPQKVWRWGLVPLVGQFLWMLCTQGPGNLLPLGIIVFGLLSVPSIITAKIGAFIRRRTG